MLVLDLTEEPEAIYSTWVGNSPSSLRRAFRLLLGYNSDLSGKPHWCKPGWHLILIHHRITKLVLLDKLRRNIGCIIFSTWSLSRKCQEVSTEVKGFEPLRRSRALDVFRTSLFSQLEYTSEYTYKLASFVFYSMLNSEFLITFFAKTITTFLLMSRL